MNMTMDIIMAMIDVAVFVVCAIAGCIMKKHLPTDNKWIPTVLPVLGIILCCFANKEISVAVIAAGALSGWAATGAHQAFTQLANNTASKILTEEMEDELNRYYIDDNLDEEDIK
jgi:uncharacterized membrane protein